MSLCFSLMFARLGAVVGANVTSLLLKSHCQLLFGLSGSLLIGKQFKKNNINFSKTKTQILNTSHHKMMIIIYKNSYKNVFISFVVAGVLSYFIPKIHQKMEDPKEIMNEPRASIFSARFN